MLVQSRGRRLAVGQSVLNGRGLRLFGMAAIHRTVGSGRDGHEVQRVLLHSANTDMAWQGQRNTPALHKAHQRGIICIPSFGALFMAFFMVYPLWVFLQ